MKNNVSETKTNMADKRFTGDSNPGEVSNGISKMFLWWFSDIIKRGYKKDLVQRDLYPPRNSDQSQLLGDRLEEKWREEVLRSKAGLRKPSLLKAMVRMLFSTYLFWMVLVFIQVIVRLSLPYAISRLLMVYNPKSNMQKEEAHLYVFIILLLSLTLVITFNQYSLALQSIGMQARIACCSILYRKILRMNRHSLGRTAAGQVVNLMSNDVNRFDLLPLFLHYLLIVPVQIPVITYLMWRDVGTSAFAGIAVVVTQAYVTQVYISRYQARLRGVIALKTDKRVKLMTELVAGIQVVKMYAWEVPFEKIIQKARCLEMKYVNITTYLRSMSRTVVIVTERLSLYATLITYILAGGGLRGDIVYSMAQYCNLLQLTCTMLFPMALMALAEARISIKRIQEFLEHEELENTIESFPIKNINEKTASDKIVLKNVSATWSDEPIINTLHNISMEVNPGQFWAIVGPVGSGKSSLLQVLIGELPPSKGDLILGNLRISYASQEPWLFVATIRENILFGQEYNKERYKKVVECCALTKDFEQFPHGDFTLVGERGISLSGGQKARITLARAVYRKADVYLLDDPLSAVDTHVGKHLMEKCIETFLAGKTRILVTHQLHHLKNADNIVIITNGHIETQGCFREMSENILFSELTSSKTPEKEKDCGDVLKSNGITRERTLSVQSAKSTTSEKYELSRDGSSEPQETDELIEKGNLSTSVVLRYGKSASGPFFLIILLISIIGTQIFDGFTEWWLKFWTNQEELRTYNQLLEANLSDKINSSGANLYPLSDDTSSNGTISTTPISIMGTLLKTVTAIENITDSDFHDEPIFTTDMALIIWSVLVFVCAGLVFIRSFLFCRLFVNASTNLHNEMFGNVLHAKMQFFHVNPSGRILNRFSKDMGAVDEILPKSMQNGVQIASSLLGIVTLVVIVNPYMIIMAVIITVILYFLTKIYMKTAQNIKRIEGITRSPVFSHVSSTLLGLSTIRSSGAQDMLQKQFDDQQDVHTSAWYLTLASSSAFGLWICFISWIFLVVIINSLVLLSNDSVHSGDMGMSITQSLALVMSISHGLREISELIAQMTCVERVLQYTDLPQETPLESLPGSEPPKDWPKRGRIVFRNMYLRYFEGTEPVLKNINITIENGWKVGVVGRTGAGKSSLISALFRLTLIDGEILIDNVDTQSIGLKDLRRKISIIPQEPVLFSAHLRYNLDPFSQHSDADIWKALDDVQLKNSISSLNQMVTEGGGNFSAGQRQLLCLARAALNNNTVMVLDEATANVDPNTDALIQKTIRNRFALCTVITVAHRLHTVADSDRVLVMDDGVAVQFDHPHVLLKDAEGLFAKMVSQLGPAAEAGIREISKNAYQTHIKYADEDRD